MLYSQYRSRVASKYLSSSASFHNVSPRMELMGPDILLYLGKSSRSWEAINLTFYLVKGLCVTELGTDRGLELSFTSATISAGPWCSCGINLV
jgi:hypothetical protein